MISATQVARATSQSGAARAATLSSGLFDDFLMLAVDRKSGRLSGYYNDGKCRFYFAGPLKPIELYQRPENGEAYELEGWNPAKPDLRFTTTIYSRARDGYLAQITLEPGGQGTARLSACRSRISLDRSMFGNDDQFAIRVMSRSRAPVYRIPQSGGRPRPAPRYSRPPSAGTGIWVARSYVPESAATGFVHINWYAPDGTPHAAYVREGDLYPLPADPS